MRRKNLMPTLTLTAMLLLGGGTLLACDTTETYSVAFAETNGVDATLSTTTAKEGDEVTITINSVPEGYEVSTITTDVSGTTTTSRTPTEYYFYMPASDVNLTINITEAVLDSYSLTIDNQSDTANISYIQANYELVDANEDGTYTIGTYYTVYVVLGAAEDDEDEENGSEDNGATVLEDDENEEETESTSVTYKFTLNGTDITSSYDSSTGLLSFTMPAQDSTLIITDATAYTITVNYDETYVESYDLIDQASGSPTTTFYEGLSLYLQINTCSGYEVASISFTPTIQYETVTGGYTFTMPDSDLTIEVTTQESTSSEPAGNTVSITNADQTSYTLYESDVLTKTDINPTSYAITNYDQSYEKGTTLGLAVSLISNYADSYDIESITVNTVDITNTREKYDYSYIHTELVYEDDEWVTKNEERQTSLELYTVTIDEGKNEIVITTSQKTLTLSVTLGTDEGVKLYYQNDLLNEIEGNNGVYSTLKYGDELQIEFTNTNSSLKVTDIDKTNEYLTLTKVSNNTYTFRMPTSDLRIDPYWAASYSASVAYTGSSIEGANLSATVTVDDETVSDAADFSAYARETVRLKYSRDESANLEIQSVEVATKTISSTVVVTDDGKDSTGAYNYSFTMPEDAIEITVTFAEATVEDDGVNLIYVTSTGNVPSGVYYEMYYDGSPEPIDNQHYESSSNTRSWCYNHDYSTGEHESITTGTKVRFNIWYSSLRNYDTDITVPSTVDDWDAGNDSSNERDWTFTMPDADVYITITWSTK